MNALIILQRLFLVEDLIVLGKIRVIRLEIGPVIFSRILIMELPEKGGLIIKKKDSRPSTGTPHSSLGLQELAQKKREQEGADGFKRPATGLDRKPQHHQSLNQREDYKRHESPRSRDYDRHESPRSREYQRPRSDRAPYERPSSNRPKSSRRGEWDQTPNRSTLGGQTPRDSTRRGTGSWSTVSKRQSSPSNWEMETPKPLFERTEAAFAGENGDDWEDNLKQLDRDWYNLEESGVNYN